MSNLERTNLSDYKPVRSNRAVQQRMSSQILQQREALATDVALVHFLVGVRQFVVLHVLLFCRLKRALGEFALVQIARVEEVVCLQLTPMCRGIAAIVAQVLLLIAVNNLVILQRVLPFERH